ncbi:MAG: hypothetical protein JKX80_00810 [Candidatus Pacebacteria bacterium]|nr:hypothetical protein [Candidatus Paceibacterota bacterium]
MSVLKISTLSRAFKITLFAVSIIFSLLLPQSVSADTLPSGVLERESCGASTVDIYGYGAGMMQSAEPIIISNQRVSFISSTEGCAVVEWQSTTPAATQVLFAPLTEEPISIVLGEANFGYPFASQQNNAGVADHRAILTGLETGKAYSYRLVTRSHPSAIPTISDSRVLIAGPSVAFTPPSITPPVVPITIPVTPTPLFDAEKFPIIPSRVEIPETTIPTAPTQAISDDTVTVTVPAAIVAASEALGGVSQEKALLKNIGGFFSNLVPKAERLSFSSSIGLFDKDRYIIPTLFFLGLLFLLQQLVLPAFNVNLKNPTLYWLLGATVLSVVSAVFMLYYVTLIGIALFLGLLAWYLVKNVPEEDSSAALPKLLSQISTTTKGTKNNKEKSKK